MDLIELIDVEKSFKVGKNAFTVFKNVNISIKQGEFIVVLGPSGSGKSTFLNLLSGLDKPTSGSIMINGDDITKLPYGDLSQWRAKHVGIVFQSFNLMPYMSAIDNVTLPMLFQGVGRRQRLGRATALLKTVGLKCRFNHPSNLLSGGEQQRVTIARALINSPEILIADEPTADLDIANATEIMEIIYSLYKEKKATIILSTHNANYAKYADRVIYISKAEVTCQKSIAK